MEKSFKLKLTADQKKDLAAALGISIDQVGVHIAYGQAIDEDAKGNDSVIATVSDKAADGKVWVVEQLAMLAERADGSNIVLVDSASAAGGLQAAPALNTRIKPGEAQGIRFNPAGTAPTGTGMIFEKK